MSRELERAAVLRVADRASAAGRPLTVVVNDAHRSTATREFLDVLFAQLDRRNAIGSSLRLRALVAAGTHRASEHEKREHEARALGPWRGRFDEIAWHDADADDDMCAIDEYRFHHWLGEGGFYLACGSVEPHYFAGLTGAHKTLTVGVMSRQSIEANHAHAMAAEARGLKLAGNPVHDGIVSALAALESSGATLMAVDQVLVDGAIVAATAGHPIAALESALPVARAHFGWQLAEPVDVVVARVLPPLDRDVYQADKGIKNTEDAVRDGGVLIVEAACEHGLGIDHFVELLRQAPTHAAAVEAVARRGYRLGDHKAVRLRALSDVRGVRLAIVSPLLDRSLSDALGMMICRDRAEAAAWADVRPKANGVLVEDAGNISVEVA